MRLSGGAFVAKNFIAIAARARLAIARRASASARRRGRTATERRSGESWQSASRQRRARRRVQAVGRFAYQKAPPDRRTQDRLRARDLLYQLAKTVDVEADDGSRATYEVSTAVVIATGTASAVPPILGEQRYGQDVLCCNDAGTVG